MNPVLKGLLGILCLLLGPVLIAITGTLLADSIGLLVFLIGLGLLAWLIMDNVRRAPRP